MTAHRGTTSRSKGRAVRSRPRKGRQLSSERDAPSSEPSFPAPVLRAVSGLPKVTIEAGWGASNVVAKHAGKMFLLLVGGELVFKLPKPRVDDLVARSGGRRFDPRRNGKLMKEWIVLPRDFPGGPGLAREAVEFAGSSS